MVNWTKYESRFQLPADGIPFLALIYGNKKYRVLPVVVFLWDDDVYQYLFSEKIGDEKECVKLKDIICFSLINDEKGVLLE